jgi:hypothetical protein
MLVDRILVVGDKQPKNVEDGLSVLIVATDRARRKRAE